MSRNLFVVLFPGFELLDAAGPLQMFGNLPEVKCITVAETKGWQGSAKSNIQWSAGYSFAEAQSGAAGPIHWVLVPGGIGTRTLVSSAPLLHFLRHAAASAELVMSVCTGAALLAAAGLLEGRRATSNKRAWAWVISVHPSPVLQAEHAGGTAGIRSRTTTSNAPSTNVAAGIDLATDINSDHAHPAPDAAAVTTRTGAGGAADAPVNASEAATSSSFRGTDSSGDRKGGGGITWVYKARWVWDGPIVTSAGVSAGMDMALAVVARQFGDARAKELADFAEYEAHSSSEWEPFSDMYPQAQETH